ncbi:hypothetical protein [Streptomyces natalensis]|uniref:hypothetical protein n=1 Tax=Streptomyces natalensis TaxID=68242 RepID=UPI000AA2F5E4|nr:hypothetical protein [Streptomyces natalensis]
MSGRHVREHPSRPGLAVAVLGTLGLMPPAVILGWTTEAHSAPASVSCPDTDYGALATTHSAPGQPLDATPRTIP